MIFPAVVSLRSEIFRLCGKMSTHAQAWTKVAIELSRKASGFNSPPCTDMLRNTYAWPACVYKSALFVLNSKQLLLDHGGQEKVIQPGCAPWLHFASRSLSSLWARPTTCVPAPLGMWTWGTHVLHHMLPRADRGESWVKTLPQQLISGKNLSR